MPYWFRWISPRIFRGIHHTTYSARVWCLCIRYIITFNILFFYFSSGGRFRAHCRSVIIFFCIFFCFFWIRMIFFAMETINCFLFLLISMHYPLINASFNKFQSHFLLLYSACVHSIHLFIRLWPQIYIKLHI